MATIHTQTQQMFVYSELFGIECSESLGGFASNSGTIVLLSSPVIDLPARVLIC